MRPKIRTRAAVLPVLAGALLLAAGGAVLAMACVPDLEVSSLAVPEAAPPAPACGDGFVDLEAGEQCDPGEAGAVGCTRACAVDCFDGGGFVDDASMHCYFAPGRKGLSFDQARSTCAMSGGAHVVTFSGDSEYQKVYAWASAFDASFWIGLQEQQDPTGPQWVAAQSIDNTFEPGWSAACPGCFAHATDAGSFARVRPEAGLGPCLISGSSASSAWIGPSCTGTYGVICEREPPGRSIDLCNGLPCITLRATFGRKRYLYFGLDPSQVLGPDDAAMTCAGFPSGRLVVLESREEREQLWRELVHLNPAPTAVWIGLTTIDVYDPDAGVSPGTWDDGKSHPNPWGLFQPRVAGRAYLFLGPTVATADSELARTAEHDDETGLDNPPSALPFVCETTPTP